MRARARSTAQQATASWRECAMSTNLLLMAVKRGKEMLCRRPGGADAEVKAQARSAARAAIARCGRHVLRGTSR